MCQHLKSFSFLWGLFPYIYSKLALLLFKAIPSCNTSSLVSLKGW